MYHCYGGLPAAVRLFFGDGDRVFLGKQHAAEDACGEGKQKRGAGVPPARAV